MDRQTGNNKYKNTAGVIYGIGEWIVLILGLILTFGIGILQILFYVHTYLGDMSIDYRGNAVLWTIGGCIAEFLVLYALRGVLSRIPDRKLFLVLSALYIAAGLFLIFSCDSGTVSDAGMLTHHAQLMNAGDYQGLDPGHYLDLNPVQLGFLSYERIVLALFHTTRAMFILNLVWTLVQDWALWRIVSLYSDDLRVRNLTILLSFLFLPSWFLILFAYGLTPGFSCLLVGTHLILRFLKKGGSGACAGGLAFTALACVMKNNYLIGAVALGVLVLAEFLRRRGSAAGDNSGASNSKSWAVLLLIPALAVAAVVPMKGIEAGYRSVSGRNFDHGEPISSYIAMGLHWNDGVPAGGYDGFNFDNYYAAGFSTEEADRRAKADIAERVNFFREHPAYTASFFAHKLVWTWCEPVYGTVVIGPIECLGLHTYNAIAQSFYTDGWALILAERMMNSLNVLIFIGSGLYLITGKFVKKRRLEPWELLPYIYLIGGFLFHLVSETKPHYVETYVVSLLPTAAVMLVRGWDLIAARKTVRSSGQRKPR